MPLFSGEPLPVAPREPNAERAAFDRKLLDYLRRLSARLDAANEPPPDGEMGFGQVEALSCFLTSNHAVSSGGTAGALVEWDENLWQDSAFSHSSGNVLINKDGFYIFLIDLAIDFSGFVDATAFFSILDGSGTALAFVEFGEGHTVTNTYTMTIGLPLPAGTRVGVYLKTNADDAAGLLSTGSRFNAMRLRNTYTGGDGTPGGIGWVPNSENGDYPDWIRIAEL